MSESIARDKSELFAIRIINLARYIRKEKKEYSLADQILRSGTSIAANLAESECAISKNDFISKVYISLKECAETMLWLRLFKKTDIINEKEFESIYKDCEELKKILNATLKTIKSAK
ncbi:MAG: four helix bundle protein [Rickettsiales bacterium]|jgi:four helix bundle protein|nr:four helix bundle protein [Rickettsiales bacterium]